MAWDRKRRRFSDSGAWAFVSSNLSFAFFIVLAGIIMMVSRAENSIFDSTRNALSDVSAPVFGVLSEPAGAVKRWMQGLDSFLTVYEENQRLREENTRLQAAQSDLAELQRKVQRYEELLRAQTDPSIASVAARVIADATGPFVRTVLINAGHDQGVAKGQAVVDERGLLGRVITSGDRSARILLLTDLNSRIPVMVEGVNFKAILAGDNSLKPALEYLPPGARIPAGARVVTTPDGGVFPPGVAVGTVDGESRSPRVILFTSEGRADFVRILSYTAQLDVDHAAPEPLPGERSAIDLVAPPPVTPEPTPQAATVPPPAAAAPPQPKPRAPKPAAPPAVQPATTEPAAPAVPPPAPVTN